MAKYANNYSFEKLNQALSNEKFFVVDEKVFNLHRDNLPFLNEKFLYLVKDPEADKSLDGYERLMDYLLRQKITRGDRIVAIGGGAVGDLAGFAASTVLRGVDWICVPTTLLSIIDSSIGGKTGINTKYGKNLIGSFHNPAQTLVALEFLETLDPAELESGRGELLKYAFLDSRVSDALKKNSDDETIIELCRQAKTEIVERDFRESGERAKLNLGHTFGHVFEKMLGIPHGVAVAMGLEMIVDLFSPELFPTLELFKKCLGLKCAVPTNLEEDVFWSFLSSDKKSSHEGITMVIPRSGSKCDLKKYTIDELKLIIGKSEKYKSIFK